MCPVQELLERNITEFFTFRCLILCCVDVTWINRLKNEHNLWGIWVAQSVKRLTLDFSSGHGLSVCEFEPRVSLCADSVEPAWDPLSAPPLLTCSFFLSLKINKINIKKITKKWHHFSSKLWDIQKGTLPRLQASSGPK